MDKQSENSGSPATPLKKKPGRPKKQNINAILPFCGVCDKPTQDDNEIELIYNNPMLFKKIHSILKSFVVDLVYFIFKKDELEIKSVDHTGRTTIQVTIRGECMNSYYCNEPTQISINRTYMDAIFSSIDKNNFMICLAAKNGCDDRLYVISGESPYLTKDMYDLVIHNKIPYIEDDNHPILDAKDYPVKFELSHNFIKAKIINFKKVGDLIKFALLPGQPLQISIISEKNGTKATSQFEKDELIKLENKLENDQALIIDMLIDSIRPFTSNSNSENVTIFLDPKKLISLSTNFDKQHTKWAATISIFTNSGK